MFLQQSQFSTGLPRSRYPSWGPSNPSRDNPGSAGARHGTTVTRQVDGKATSRIQEARSPWPQFTWLSSAVPIPAWREGSGRGHIEQGLSPRSGRSRNLSSGRDGALPDGQRRRGGWVCSDIPSKTGHWHGAHQKGWSDVTWISSALASWSLSRA